MHKTKKTLIEEIDTLWNTHSCTGEKSEMAHPRMKKFTPKIAENSDLTR